MPGPAPGTGVRRMVSLGPPLGGRFLCTVVGPGLRISPRFTTTLRVPVAPRGFVALPVLVFLRV